MRQTALSAIVTAILCIALAFGAQAQSTPRWVLKGAGSINSQRSNDTYTLETFNTYNAEIEVLEEKATDVLKKYVIDKYGAYQPSIQVVTLSEGVQPVYEVIYKDSNDLENHIVAKRIDVFTDFDDYELNVYQFEYHQLYAISKPNVAPMFDEFEFTNSYKGLTTGMSLIPGMAQIYKGQDTKGYVIIGAEAFFAVAGVIMENKRSYCHKMISEQEWFADSWRSKTNGWRNLEIGAAAGFVGVYIYNIIDGLKSKGAKQVKVKKANSPKVTMIPYATTNEGGLSFTVTF